MNIIFFIQNFSRGHGSERATGLIASYLAEQGNNITILSICGNNTSFYNIDERVKLHTLINEKEVDNKKEFFRVISRYKQFIEKNKPDIIIDIFAVLSIYSVLIKRKCRYRNITWEHWNYYKNSGMNYIGRKVAIQRSDLIVTLTKTDMETYLDNNSKLENRIVYINNPTPYQSIPFDFAEHKEIVVAVGRLTKQKAFGHLINVWKELEKMHPSWKLQFVGDGEEKENLIKQVQSNNLMHVEFVGEVKSISEYYKHASILASTSDYEGLPMNMIEAQSFGVPIVSFDYYTGPRDIIVDGENGYIINSNNQEEKNRQMISKLDTLMNNAELRKKMMHNSLKMSKRFQIEHIGQQWMRICRDIVK